MRKKNTIVSDRQLSFLDLDFDVSVPPASKNTPEKTEQIVLELQTVTKVDSQTAKEANKPVSVETSSSSETKNQTNENSSKKQKKQKEDKQIKEEEQTESSTDDSEPKKLALLVDGSNFVYRAFYALPQLTNPNNQPVGAVYGFCSMLLSLFSKHQSDLFCVALDAGRDTFRRDLYPKYKSNRDETPENLKSQFPILIEACKAFGVPLIEINKYEADDIIATLATKLESMNYEVRIIASDKDLMQLINENIYLFDPIKSKVIKEPEVLEKFGVTPNQMISLQTLMGDSTDSIPGVAGIGPKTAAKLLDQFHSIENIYEKIEEVTPERIKNKLIDQKENIKISRQLVTLCRTVPIEQDISELKIDLNPDRVKEFLNKHRFNSLLKRFEKQVNQVIHKQRHQLNLSTSIALQSFFKLNDIKKFSMFSTTCFNQNEILVICTDSYIVNCFFNQQTNNNPNLLSEKTSFTLTDLQQTLKPYIEDESIEKIGFRGILKLFPNIKSFNDIGSMSYLLHGVLGNKVSDVFPGNDSPVCKMSFSEISDADQCRSLAEIMFDEFESFKTELEQNNLLDIYKNIDMPLISVLNAMESKGILLSTKKLKQVAEGFKEDTKSLETELFKLAGHAFNPASGKQLSKLLFEELKIPKPSKKNSMDIEALEDLSDHSPIPNLVIQWRKLAKLISTYTSSLCNLINPQTHRLHTKFNTTVTSTGRLSSSNPNLQTIPHRTEQGRKIRSAFISPEGSKLVSFDYSQIELRVLAHMADIKSLKEAFLNNLDIHTATASQIFNVKLEEVTPEMRTRAKTINFGIIYGMSHNRLARSLNISVEDAKKYIQNYFDRFPEFPKFHESILEFSRKNGYVQTLLGRRCFVKGLSSKNPILRSSGERQAFNAVIQGTAADIVKIAMIKVFSKQEELHTSMIIQIHDELVFETPNEFVEASIPIITEIMENAYTLSIPLVVESKYGDYLK